jgi:hypothetical protein
MNAFKVSSGLVLFRDVEALVCQNMLDVVQASMRLWQVGQVSTRSSFTEGLPVFQVKVVAIYEFVFSPV